MLKGENLSFRYHKDKPWIFQGKTLTVDPGEVVGLSGPSGQGKTTLAKILTGYLQPQTGQVTVNGRFLPAKGYCPVQLIFQHPELAINPRWRMSQVLAEGQPPTADLLEALSLNAGWLTRWPHELSGGELQRMAVARVLNRQTEFLIADEMTAMLDTITQAQIWQVVLGYARRYHMGVLVISHDAALMGRICDRVIGMNRL